MAADPSQLYLLCDHVKLSLLERQRAMSMNLNSAGETAELESSLESLRSGIEALSEDQIDQAAALRSQYQQLLTQYKSAPGSDAQASGEPSSPILTTPNDNRLSEDFSRAQQVPPMSTGKKSVRFSASSKDLNSMERDGPTPYRDDPDEAPDHSNLDNRQIHQYHTQVLRDQDDQLDRLGESISRQRDLSIQIGDELDEQAQMLDDVDDGVSRHQTQLDRARSRIGNVARKAKDNWSITTIAILIIILLLLIIVLKT